MIESSLKQMAAALAAKSVSSVELTQLYLERIAHLLSLIHIFTMPRRKAQPIPMRRNSRTLQKQRTRATQSGTQLQLEVGRKLSIRAKKSEA